MPRKPRNPGSGKPPHNGPARGGPAKGPANGPGWGGPAKGKGTGGPASGTEATGRPAMHDNLAAIADCEEALRKMTDIMRTAEFEGLQPAAAEKLLDRLEGKPRQAVEMSGKGGGPIQTQQVEQAAAKLTQEERLALLAIYRKAGLKLPGE
jgi:hypothetical protein